MTIVIRGYGLGDEHHPHDILPIKLSVPSCILTGKWILLAGNRPCYVSMQCLNELKPQLIHYMYYLLSLKVCECRLRK